MISSKKLVQMARKWLAAAVARRKRIPFHRAAAAMAEYSDVRGSALAKKGNFVVYSSDGRRFEVPLAYLKSDVFAELLMLSEDVFGLPSAGPITLPCDAASTGSVLLCLQKQRSPRDAERALLASMASHPCSMLSAPCSLQTNQQIVVWAY